MSEEKKIIIDEDWKSQVTAEKEAADKQAAETGADEAATGQPGMFPEASIEMLISIFVTEAMVGMGQIPHPATGQPQPSLEQSRYAIDMLEVLQEKTKGNLSDEEENTLRDLLHQLRMAFVAVQSQQQPPTSPIQTE
ncbi:DUF1844 domain-containing protein [Adhaeretor mobilis]|uniref:DUF1844 domain-containing protein n=1 Tax=Adhaeretor mobilis TaxID=1930276 RepID=A0A517MTB1_9BACT|nr:DUF1844 domain-containing protein [Adhaeretor mobilis]QDS98092.1 hypothetical protein HG15A2_13640 [Adhaeretor mobilis]